MAGSYNHADRNEDGPQDCGAFFLDAVGPYARGQISIRWSEEPRPTIPAVESLIERFWDRRLAQAQREGSKLWDGPLCRLVDYRVNDKSLDMTLGPTGYRAFVGTNLHNAHLRYLHGPEVLASPLGVSANVIIGGNYILLGLRSSAVTYHAGRIHPIGGCIEPSRDGGLPDPFAAMIEELQEELGVRPDQVGEMVCLGLVRDKHIVQPELIFDMPVAGSADEIRARIHATMNTGGEHTELVVVRNHPASVVTFIESHYAQLTPVALASLLLHGLHNWGSGWFASTRGYLRSLI